MTVQVDKQVYADEQAHQDEVLAARRKAKKRAKAASRRVDENPGNLNLNSMMDMMTIILCFLLKSYGEEPLKVLGGVDLPFSTNETLPEDMTTITISDDSLILLDKKVLDLTEDRRVDAKHKLSGANEDLTIKTLLNELKTTVDEQKKFAQRTKTEFKGELIIIADSKTPYRLLTEVIQTSLQAEFTKFHFAVLKGDIEFSGTSTADKAN